MEWAEQALNLGAASGVGLLIGIERGWNLRGSADGDRVAGVRTFTLIGMFAGVAGILGRLDLSFAVAGLVSAAAAVILIGYFHQTVRGSSPDATSAIAALVTLALGLLAGIGNPALAIAAAALVMMVLAMRTQAHGFIARMDSEDIKALARFGLIAAAVLPFLPDGNFGPYDAWNAKKLWLVVIVITGLSFAGYVANRIFGARHGTMATAIIGGAYSSTAVTQALAQRLGSAKSSGAEPAGIALASAVMYLRVLLLVAVLATSVVVPFALLISPALLTGGFAGYLLYRRVPAHDGPAPPGNPIALIPALSFVTFLAVAAVCARWAEGRFGEQGLALLILIMGTMDVDAAIVTVGGLRPGAIATNLAAVALCGTILANMVVKLGITLVYAGRAGRSAALALASSMVVLAGTLVVGQTVIF